MFHYRSVSALIENGSLSSRREALVDSRYHGDKNWLFSNSHIGDMAEIIFELFAFECLMKIRRYITVTLPAYFEWE